MNAQYQVYAGTYYDMNIYEATAEGGESDSYCQIEVSNITDQTFDFAVYQLTDGNKQMILDVLEGNSYVNNNVPGYEFG